MGVPLNFFQGDTVEWDQSLAADYPATDWLLTYKFVNAAGSIEVVADADGDNYTVTLSPAVTATYIPGDYTWVAKVTDIATGAQAHTVLAGCTSIQPDVSSRNSYDARSWAEIALEAVEAVIANRGGREARRVRVRFLINGLEVKSLLISQLKPGQKRPAS